MSELDQERNRMEERRKQIYEKYRNFDFSRMSLHERQLVDELSQFTFQNSFLNLLKKNYGGTNIKQKYIDTNKMYLDHNDMAILNEQTIKYKNNSRDGSIAITTIFTFAALIYGIIVLPARRSPVKHTVIGFGTGIALSYAFWRLQLYRFDQKINMLFRKVVKDQYEQLKAKNM